MILIVLMNCSLFVSLVLLIGFYRNLCLVRCVAIHGITIRKWPYANKLGNGQFEGFCVDLLNEIAAVTRVAYTLQLADENIVGDVRRNGTVDGIIGHVYRNGTDFAIADITVTDNRERVVDFTHPFLRFSLSALIRKDYKPANITSLAQLADQTDIEYGVKRFGAHLPLIHESEVISKMFNHWDLNPNAYVFGTDEDGLRRAKTSKFAFITEHPFNEYIVNRDCDLTVIEDTDRFFDYGYAIAFRKGLAFKNVISNAIKHLEANGKLKKLKDRYWKTEKCVNYQARKQKARMPYEFHSSEVEKYMNNKKTVKNSRLTNWSQKSLAQLPNSSLQLWLSLLVVHYISA